MKLYHGTTIRNLDKILKYGIAPRGETETNWKRFPSRPDMIYLSTAYPFYFAHSAQFDEEGCVVFEVDVQDLDVELLYPDEDFIYQCLKEKYGEETNKEIHEEVKNNIEQYQHYWVESIRHMGNCSYKGVIPSAIISRYCIVDFTKRTSLNLTALDPTISILNYRIKGEYYRNLVAWFFGDRNILPQVDEAKIHTELFGDAELTDALIETKRHLEFWLKESADRTGITVVKVFL